MNKLRQQPAKRCAKNRRRAAIVCAALIGLAPLTTEARTAWTAAQAYNAACPEQWKLLNTTIDPAAFSTTPWSNAADRAAFREYWRRYLFKSSLNISNFDAIADDPITVASECALRRDRIVDNYFGKVIDTVTAWYNKINLTAIIMMLLGD